CSPGPTYIRDNINARRNSLSERLKLKTVLSLIPDSPRPELVKYCADGGINHITLRIEKAKENVPWTYTKVAQALQIVIDPENAPLYVHCLDGANVTGVLIIYVGGGHILQEEFAFVEKFTAELDLPQRLPKWLWGGSATGFGKKHPTLNTKHLRFANLTHVAERADAFGNGGIDSARDDRDRRDREGMKAEMMMGEYRKRSRAFAALLLLREPRSIGGFLTNQSFPGTAARPDLLGEKSKAAPLSSPSASTLPLVGGAASAQRGTAGAESGVAAQGQVGSAAKSQLAEQFGGSGATETNEEETYTEDDEDDVEIMGTSMTLEALALEGFKSAKDWD
ncbi:MAG: hypothetical protein BJ554DRAFT_7139, partial [Olpidium bornovanus]